MPHLRLPLPRRQTRLTPGKFELHGGPGRVQTYRLLTGQCVIEVGCLGFESGYSLYKGQIAWKWRIIRACRKNVQPCWELADY